MRFSRLPLLSAVVLSMFALATSAQDTSKLPDLSNTPKSQAAAKSSETLDKQTTIAPNTKATVTPTGSSGTAKVTGTETTDSKSPVGVITGSGSAAASVSSVAVITGGESGTNTLPKDLPTIAGVFTIVAPSVPPTAGAPFMRPSTLPEGTVFIVVGAILGFLAMSVLLWRGLVAWSLHRSVKRAAEHQNMSHEKAMFRTPAAPFYNYKDHESSISLAGIGKKRERKGNNASPRPPTMVGATSQSSLFFSPTAGAVGGGINQAGNRGSNYLPAGYYAAGASQPGNGQGAAHIGGHHQSISMSNLVPNRDGYARAKSVGPSPPGTPDFRPHAASSSTLNLSQVPGEQRAPSAYLEDLFDGDSAPPVPGHAGPSQPYGANSGRF